MNHALVAGGTGMLGGVTRWLADKGHSVSVIARSEARLRQFEQYNPHIHGVPVNYYETDKLTAAIHRDMDAYGEYGLVVCWVHTFEPLLAIRDAIAARQQTPWDLYRIRGSGDLGVEPDTVELPPGCRYHEVILGFKIENGRSRWLTHQEISGGIIEAIAEGRTRTVIGRLEPRDRRPAW